MAKNPNLLIELRRNEILNAFLKLYESKSFSEINIKAISAETSFTRTTIYSYFKSIDEIFISAYQNEYALWAEDLTRILNEYDALTHEGFADQIALSLTKRERMLRLTTVNFHDREENCRKEFIFQHKFAFSNTINVFHDCIAKFCPEKTEEEIYKVLYIFFPFLHGMYRYVDITPVQDEARKASNLRLKDTSIYTLTYNAIMQLLK